jgi:hypothetical protein
MKLSNFVLERNLEFISNNQRFAEGIKNIQILKREFFRSIEYKSSLSKKIFSTLIHHRISRTKKLIKKFIISKRKYKWVFIIGCYNSGTTLLSRILEQHPQIAGLPDEGHFLTEELLTPRQVGIPRLWAEKEELFTIASDEKKELAKIVMQDWQEQVYKVKAKYVLEKSPPDILRLLWIQNNFPDAHFIHIVRNGYAVSLGIEKLVKKKYGERDNLLEKAANQWQRSNEVFQREQSNLKNVIEISYEELSENPKSTLNKITNFLKIPEMSLSVFNKQYSPHREKSKIRNMNGNRLEKMTEKQKKIIESKAEKMLKKYNYYTL